MRRLSTLLIVIVLMISVNVKAQTPTYIDENFDATTGTTLPTGWSSALVPPAMFVAAGAHWQPAAGGVDGTRCVTAQPPSGKTSVLTSPQFVVPTNKDYSLTFQYKNTGSCGVKVKVITSDTTVYLNTVALSSASFATQSYSLVDFKGDTVQIAFEAARTSTTAATMFLDNIVANAEPTCKKPFQLAISGTTQNSATLSWGVTGAGAVPDYFQIHVRDNAGNLVVSNDSVTGTGDTYSYVLTNLTAGTLYTAWVRSDCDLTSSEDFSDSIAITFITKAAGIAAPYTQDFETATLTGCYLIKSTVNTSATYSRTGNNSLKLTTSSGKAYIEFPALNLAGNDIEFTYSIRREVNTTTAGLGNVVGPMTYKVGYLTDPNDLNTFVQMKVETLSGGTEWNNRRVNSSLTGVATDTVVIPCIIAEAGQSSSLYVDDVLIRAIPACIRPENVKVITRSHNTVTLDWETSTAANYAVIAYESTGDEYEVQFTSQHPYTFDNLEAESTYTFKVVGICSTTVTSDTSLACTATTLCAPDSTPVFLETFDEFIGSYAAPACWTMGWLNKPAGVTTTAPFNINSMYRHGTSGYGMGVMKMAVGTTSYLSTPVLNIDEANKYDVTLWVYRQAAASYPTEGIEIWITDKVNDTTGGVRLGKICRHYLTAPVEAAVGSYEYVFQIPVSGMKYLMIYAESMNGAATYFDDISVSLSPSCRKVSKITEGAITHNSYSIAWTPGASETQWVVDYVITNGTDTVMNATEVTNAASFTAAGLQPKSSYTFSCNVRALCGEGDTSVAVSYSKSFTTICGPRADYPYYETFESYTAGSTNRTQLINKCWMAENTATAYNWITDAEGNVYAGGKSLCITTDSAQVVALPEVDTLAGLKLSFAYKTEAQTGMEIGYITTDAASFVSMQTVEGSATAYAETIYRFPATVAAGARPAFRTTGAGNVYMDNIRLNREVLVTVYDTILIGNPYIKGYWNIQNPKTGTYVHTWTGDSTATGCDSTVTLYLYVSVPLMPLFLDENFDATTGTTLPTGWTSSLVPPAMFVAAGAHWQPATGGVDGTRCATAQPPSGKTSILTSPQFFIPANKDYSLTFQYKNTGSCGVKVKVITADTTVYLNTDPLSSALYATQTYSLADFKGDSLRIAFEAARTSTTAATMYLDNIVANVDPTCKKPFQLVINGTTQNSANLSWGVTGMGAVPDYFQVRVRDNAGNLVVSNDSVTGTGDTYSYVLTNLTAGTLYTAWVRSDCDLASSEDFSDSVAVTFITTAAGIAAPYAQDFETATLTGCYLINSTVNTSATYSRTGSNSLKLTTSSGKAYIEFPALNLAGNDIEFTYSIRREVITTTAGLGNVVGPMTYKVGYLTDPNDLNTFVQMKVETLSGGTEWNNRRVNSSLTGVATDTVVIPCIIAEAGQSSSLYVDDVLIRAIPACIRPENVKVITRSHNTVTLDWEVSNAANYAVVAYDNTGEEYDVQFTSQHPYTFDGLGADSTYTFNVVGICSTTETSDTSLACTATTLCAPDSTPIFLETFDEFIGSYAAPACWTMGWLNKPAGVTTTAPFNINSMYRHGTSGYGMGVMKMAVGTTSYLSTPVLNIDEANKYDVTLWVYRQAAASYPTEGIEIWITDRVNDTTGGVRLGKICRHYLTAPVEAAVGSYEYVFQIPVSGMKYLMIYAESMNGAATYFDDISVSLSPSCRKVSKITEGAITHNSYGITWTPGASETQWVVDYVITNGTDTVMNATEVTNAASFTAAGLQPKSSYTFSCNVRALCGEGDTSVAVSYSKSFTTICGPRADYPYYETFESYTAGSTNRTQLINNCWIAENTANAYNWITDAEGSVYAGGKSLCITTDSTANTQVVALPEVDALAGLRLSFAYKTDAQTSMEIGYIANDTAPFVSMQTVEGSATAYTETVYRFPATVAAGARPAFRTTGAGNVYMDNIRLNKVAEIALPNDTVCYNGGYNEYGFNCPAGTLLPGDTTLTRFALSTEFGESDSVISITVNVRDEIATTVYDTVCAGQPYTVGYWNIQNPQTDTYVHTWTGDSTVTGCDSTVTLYLYVASVYHEMSDTICQGESVTLYNTTYTETGIYVATGTNRFGCNDTTMLYLTVVDSLTVTYDTICNGDSYLFHGNTYTTAGTYTVQEPGLKGCDVTHRLFLTVNPTDTTVDVHFCQGGSVVVADTTITESGSFVIVRPAATGCNMTYYITATMDSLEIADAYDMVCEGYNYTGNGIVDLEVTADTTVYVPTRTFDNRCDSMTAVHLTLIETQYSDTTAQIFAGDSIEWHGKVYTEAGDYSDTLKSIVTGCDSVVTLHLSVEQGVETISDVRIEVIPNPINAGATTMVYGNFGEVTAVEIMNNFGQVIDRFVPQTYPIEVSGIAAPGLYYVRLTATDGKVYIEKLIVK